MLHSTASAAVRLFCLAILSQAIVFGLTPSTITLTASPNPSGYGKPVVLNATVTSGATGKVTFYDGTTVLGVGTISGAQASLTTVLLASGTRSLRAYYSGDLTYAPSTSSALSQAVIVEPAPGFQPAVNTALGNLMESIAVGDFDGDGKQDLVVVDVSYVYVLLGNGNGTFQPVVKYLNNNYFSSAAVGDFNGDGHPDLVVTAGSTVYVLLGAGDGTFPTVIPEFVAVLLNYVAVGDFNGDGKADIAVASALNGSVSVALGNGDGTFQNATTYPTGASPVFIAIGDFNKDGIPDLAVANEEGGTISILLGNGNGTFQAAVNYNSSSFFGRPTSIAVEDFNRDGSLDLAVADENNDQVGILLGNGDGTFQPVSTFAAQAAGMLVSADFDGDGIWDLAVANRSVGFVNVFHGNGDGTFQAAGRYTTPSEPGPLVVGEFNGDERPDLAIADYNYVSIIANGSFPDLAISITTATSFTRGQIGALYKVNVSNAGVLATVGGVYASVTLPAGLNATAISGNGWTCALGTLSCTRSDILPVGTNFPPITVAVNVASDAALSLTTTATVSGGGDITPANDTASFLVHVGLATVTTLTSTPNPSILGQAVTLTATITAGTGKVTFYDGTTMLGTAPLSTGQAQLTTELLPAGNRPLQAQYDGDSTYGPSISAILVENVTAIAASGLGASNYPVPANPYFVATGDFNGDGFPDVVTLNSDSSVSVLLGNGNGTFRSAVTYSVSNITNSVVVGDFNGDGKSDLAIGMNNAATLAILIGKGDGTFQAPVYIPVGAAFESLAVADFNQDGVADLAVVLSSPRSIAVFIGNGDGSFQPPISSTVSGIGLMTVGDFNKDGKPDVAVTFQDAGVVAVLLGNGDGTFQPEVDNPGVFAAYSLTTADLNGDGKLDLAVGTLSVDAYILLGNGDGTFQSPMGYSAGSYNYSIAVGDFNGDGKLDVATANYTGDSLTVLLGNGDGTLGSPANYPVGESPYSIAVADFNHDGKSDVVIANSASANVTVLLGSGGGSFSGLTINLSHPENFIVGQTGSYHISIGNFTFAANTGTVTVTDMLPAGLTASTLGGTGWACNLAAVTCARSDTLITGATFPDITLTVNVGNGLGVSTLTNNVSVTTTRGENTASDVTHIVLPSSTSLSASPNPIAFGQPLTLTATVSGGLTGKVLFYDSTVELGVAPLTGGSATLITKNLGSGLRTLRATYSGDASSGPSTSTPVFQTVRAMAANGLAAAVPYTAGNGPSFVAAADFDGDGKIDMAVVNATDASVSIFLGNGNGTFQSKVDYPAGSYPHSLAVADLNGDGKPDLVVTGQSAVIVLLGSGGGTFSPPVSYPVSADPVSIALGDFNGDGIPDVAVAKSDSGLSILLGNGDGTFQPPVSSLLYFAPDWATAGDLNGDGRTDLAVAETGPNVHTFLGVGDGSFQFNKTLPLGYPPPVFVTVGDLNGDGKLDIITANNAGFVSVLLGNGDGTFQGAISYPAGGWTSYVAVGDIDGDGYPDLAVANSRSDSNQVFVLLGNGDGTFKPPVSYAAGMEPACLAIADFNGDGLADLAVTNVMDGTVSVLLGVSANLTTITTNPSGLSVTVDGTAYTAPISFAWAPSSNHTLNVGSPQGTGTRYAFTSWSDSGAQLHTIVVPNSATTYTATFATQYLLTTGIVPPASGTITAVPSSSDGYYNSGTSVQLTGVPAAGYPFSNFTGDLTGGINPQSIVMSAPRSVTANFVLTYTVGDVFPFTADTAPNFGDGALTIQDLIQVLFAVNNVPGFRPAACSDRFDAMDLFPVDVGATRGGDGLLDIRDLILELFRVNNLDLDRPVRASRGGVCGGGASPTAAAPAAATRNIRPPGAAQGALVLGEAEKTADGSERIPIYLEASRDLVRVAVTFALGDQRSQLRFVSTAATPPSLAQDSQVGVIAVAWLEGVSVRPGERLLLGYVAGPAGALANLRVYGISASGLDDNREVRLEASTRAGR